MSGKSFVIQARVFHKEHHIYRYFSYFTLPIFHKRFLKNMIMSPLSVSMTVFHSIFFSYYEFEVLRVHSNHKNIDGSCLTNEKQLLQYIT